MLALAVSLVALLQSDAQPSARDIVRTAERAAVGDSTEAVERRWTNQLKPDSTNAPALLGLGWSAFATYRYERANQLLSLASERAGDRIDIRAWARLGLADAAFWQGDLRTAEATYADAATVAEEARDSAAVVRALETLGGVIARRSGVNAALPYFRQAEPWVDQGDPGEYARHVCQRAAVEGNATAAQIWETARLAREAEARGAESVCLTLLVQSLVNRGSTDSLAVMGDSVVWYIEASHDTHSLATVLQWLGYYARVLGTYPLAANHLRRAVMLGEQSGNRLAVAWSLINLSGLAITLGDPVEGTTYAQRAAAMLEEMGDLWGLATVRGFEGTLWRMMGDHEAARAAHHEALEAAHQMQRPNLIMAMHAELGTTALLTGEYDEAEREFATAGDVARNNGLEGYLEATNENFINVALLRGDLETADRLLEHFYHVPEQAPRRSAILVRIGEVHARRGETLEAEQMLRSATDLLERWRADLDDRRLRLHAFQIEEGQRGFATIVTTLAEAGRLTAAFELAERRNARELLDQLLRADLLANRETARRQQATVSLAELQQAIPDSNTAVFKYVIGAAEPTALLVITRNVARGYRLDPIDSLRPNILRLIAMVEAGSSFDSLSRTLGRQLLGSALDELPSAVNKLVMVNEGVIHRIPFDVLTIGDDQLIERFAISSVPSASIAARLWRMEESGEPATILAIGDPVFPPADDQPDDAETARYESSFAINGGLPRLRGSGREARNVARYSEERLVKTRDEASEYFLKTSQLESFGVIHLATHAVVDTRAVTRTAIALAPGNGEDGFVSPSDLAALKLNARMVVLSACRTAGGVVIRGEGMQGLTAPLLEAGARSITATRWRVEDRTALRLVEDLYRGLARGLPTSDALHWAKQQARARGEPAAVWAAFTLIGDPSILIPLTEPASTPWRWAIVPLVLIAFGTFLWRRTAVRSGR